LVTIYPNNIRQKKIMRKRFEQQLSLGAVPISDIKITENTRDDIPKILMALQKIFLTKEYNDRIFQILEECITKNKKKTGRPGMDLWQIFVLAQLRLGLDIDYDRLHNLANCHTEIQGILGIYNRGNQFEEPEKISYQNIKDNVPLLDDENLRKINQIIVEFGHKEVFKKKETESFNCKADSYVIESNIHYPTDYNLLWDSAKKCLDVIEYFSENYADLEGWRKIRNWHNELKHMMRGVFFSQRGGGKGKPERIATAASEYCKKATNLLNKINKSKSKLNEKDKAVLEMKLDFYSKMLEKHINLTYRRLVNKEEIPHEEKVFSIFETYTELIKKGKLSPDKEFGKRLMILSDQYGLILDYELIDNEGERDVILKVINRVMEKYTISSLSLDKGFWAKKINEELESKIEKVVMRKPGKPTSKQIEKEQDNSYRKLQGKHNAVESNINELEHRGLSRCKDRGFKRFKLYVSIGICAYNLHKIGNEILKQKQQNLRKAA